MGGRRIVVTVTALFLVVAMSLPAYAASFGGDVNSNGLGINRVVWGYDENTVFNGPGETTTFFDVDPFEVNFYAGPSLVVQFTESNSVPDAGFPTVILSNNSPVEVNYGSTTYTDNPSGNMNVNTTLTINEDNIFTIYGTDNSGVDFTVSGSINFTPIPIPGAVWLLGSGLVGFVGLRKRSRKA